MRLSPDGKRIALEKGDPQSDIWIHEVNGPVRVRFTSTARNYSPVWSPDGRRLLFTAIGHHSATSSRANMVIAPVNGVENAVALAPGSSYQNPTDWSHDGRFILFENGDPGAGELWAMEARPGSVPFSVVKSPTRARDGRFSPDGKWVAYAADESGHYEVYITPFPGSGPRSQISSGGGQGPRWRQDGRELYFYSPAGTVMAVPISVTNGEVHAGNPRRLFTARLGSTSFLSPVYDVTADGKKFLIYGIGDSNAPQIPLSLVTNWRQMLKQ
jgi:eukaryotic-like serine/threonine-protein kinase